MEKRKKVEIVQIEVGGKLVDAKVCTMCLNIKQLTEFDNSKNGLGGKSNRCKSCRKIERQQSKIKQEKTCCVEGCNNKFSAKGFCDKHYRNWKLYGNPKHREIRKRKSRTEIDCVKELLDFYKNREEQPFYTSDLMAEHSGLERCIRTKFNGLREFCNKHNIDYILTAPKVVNWNDEIAVKTLKDIYNKVNSPLNTTILNKEGYMKLYQWITKNGTKFDEYCSDNGIGHVVGTVNQWNDAKCFRLIKDYFLENGVKITAEQIKLNFKGAHGYLYNVHGSFEEFIKKFDLQEYVEINNLIYDKNIAKEKLKEAYIIKGDKVNSKWLTDNGFSGLQSYIAKLGEGSFIEGCEVLGVENITFSCYTDWNDQLALDEINRMLKIKNAPLIRQDFRNHGIDKLANWIIKTYGNIQSFFDKYNMSDMFVNMAHIGQELWSYGIKFEKLAKEVVELIFEDVKYNKWVEFLNIRPDFIIGDTGLWIDAKLSSFAYFTDDTVEKYTAHEECKELWILCLRGHKFRIDNSKTKVIWIDEYYEKLRELQREDLIKKIELLKREVKEVEFVG